MANHNADVENDRAWQKDLSTGHVKSYSPKSGDYPRPSQEVRRDPPEGYASYTSTKSIRDTIQQSCRAKVLRATEKEVTVNLASFAARQDLASSPEAGAYRVRLSQGYQRNETTPDRTLAGAKLSWEDEVPVDPMDNDLSEYGEVLKDHRQPDFDMIKSARDIFVQQVDEKERQKKDDLGSFHFSDYHRRLELPTALIPD
ncbi:hypothetical protein QBC36DRAFT_308250 [Triangularia setosa]|uniref:Uncharacterized protein n=1 Tax=Triangularia setosa TaxID=2587417 RepID=A0AAN6WCM0_9PEZI|nr:hypothetical protein QBC36DRAFT_308250 [Podospora setosa]